MTTAMDRFKKNPPAAGTGAKPLPYTPRHTGVPSNNRDPYPGPGKYIVRVLETADSSYPKAPAGRDGYFKVTIEIVESNNPDHKPGSKRFISQCVTGKSEETGLGKVKAMLVALCGCKSDSELDEAMPNHDEEGRPLAEGWAGLWDAASGSPQAEGVFGQNPLKDRMAEILVTQGNPVVNKKSGEPTGEYYMNYSWSPYEAAE